MKQGYAIFRRLDANSAAEYKVCDRGRCLDFPRGVTGHPLFGGPEGRLVEVRLSVNVERPFRIDGLLMIAANDGRFELGGLDLRAEADLDTVGAANQSGQRGPVKLRDRLDRN